MLLHNHRVKNKGGKRGYGGKVDGELTEINKKVVSKG